MAATCLLLEDLPIMAATRLVPEEASHCITTRLRTFLLWQARQKMCLDTAVVHGGLGEEATLQAEKALQGDELRRLLSELPYMAANASLYGASPQLPSALLRWQLKHPYMALPALHCSALIARRSFVLTARLIAIPSTWRPTNPNMAQFLIWHNS